MALNRQDKERLVAEVKDILDSSKSVVFLNFHGLNMEETAQMRSSLREKGIGYRVAKKTLTKLALQDSGVAIEGDLPELNGELAIAYTNGDETAAAREIYSFEKDLEGRVSIQAGVFEGKLLGQKDMLEIAQIPGMLQLRGMFVNLVNSPIQRFAIVMNEIAKARA